MFLFIFLFCHSFQNTYSQSTNDILKNIDFIQFTPAIDDILDNELKNLPERNFYYSNKSNDNITSVQSAYRIAYGLSFLYLFVEYNSDLLINRDKAYQNGDGINITIAKPKPNNEPADEFYMLGFSPGSNLCFIWFKNSGTILKEINNSKISYSSNGHKTGIEILINWNDIYPFNPVLSDSIGFNMCFIKAANNEDKIFNFVKFDENIRSERNKRLYEILSFEKPEVIEKRQANAILKQSNILEKENLEFNLAYLNAEQSTENLHIKIESTDGKIKKEFNSEISFKKIINNYVLGLITSNLPSNDYKLVWNISDLKGEISFTILPEINKEEMKNKIMKLKGKIMNGSLVCLMIQLNDILTNYNLRKESDVCSEQRKNILEFNNIILQAENGTDYYATKKGLFRRYYFSKFDNTYQPYSVKIPDGYNYGNKYPLLVFLHGSGVDDRSPLTRPEWSQGRCIELAPNGRGTENCYSTPEAINDVFESIADVINNYSIDTTKIILEGFSMGGYGVCRIFYEHPAKFKALAIFSGQPDLANEWLEGEQINFLEERNINILKDIPIFIFHGKEDKNVPFEKAVEFVNKLKKINTNYLFYSENTGHDAPPKDIMEKYYNWLDDVIK